MRNKQFEQQQKQRLQSTQATALLPHSAASGEAFDASKCSDSSAFAQRNWRKPQEKSKSSLYGGSQGYNSGLRASNSRSTRATLAVLGSNRLNYSTVSSPTRSTQGDLYKKLKEGGYSYEQTRQILMARQKLANDKKAHSRGKYSPHKKSTRDLN